MNLVAEFEKTQQKTQIPPVRSGDTVRVRQRIVEGNKERVQPFEGVVIRTRKPNSLQASITVRRIASGVGVEKTFKLHAPNIEQVEIVKRAKVRRNYLSYLRQRQGKSARLREIGFAPATEENPDEDVHADQGQVELDNETHVDSQANQEQSHSQQAVTDEGDKAEEEDNTA